MRRCSSTAAPCSPMHTTFCSWPSATRNKLQVFSRPHYPAACTAVVALAAAPAPAHTVRQAMPAVTLTIRVHLQHVPGATSAFTPPLHGTRHTARGRGAVMQPSVSGSTRTLALQACCYSRSCLRRQSPGGYKTHIHMFETPTRFCSALHVQECSEQVPLPGRSHYHVLQLAYRTHMSLVLLIGVHETLSVVLTVCCYLTVTPWTAWGQPTMWRLSLQLSVRQRSHTAACHRSTTALQHLHFTCFQQSWRQTLVCLDA